MPIVNRIADLHAEIVAWRRDLHAHPELLYDVRRTAASVAEKLKSFSCDEVVTGVGRTGVVGVIRGSKKGSKTIGLRADMDAVLAEEATDLPYKSTVPGKMHACGHDGHTAMLLGAAKYLAETRNFAGTAIAVFQPAEEGGGGARAMLRDGLLERFGIDELYALHNHPGLRVGQFAIKPGAMMSSFDQIAVKLEPAERAAKPTVAAILVGAKIANQLMSMTPRNVDPQDAAVISIGILQGARRLERIDVERLISTSLLPGNHFDGSIPQQISLLGTANSLSASVRDRLEKEMREVVESTARHYGIKAEFVYTPGYPVLVNEEQRTKLAAAVAVEIAGKDNVGVCAPMMGADDFAFMLQERPGAYILLGNGDGPGLHDPAYDFNDEAIPLGASYWVRLAEIALAG